ncbi:MAG: class I SAM-dependent methyltransferase [Chitinispirillaceae bacterium]|jgi:SAM-dependent methyltransferase
MYIKSKTLFFTRSAYYALRATLLTGSRYECPLCGGRFKRFLSAGTVKRPNAACPRCSSLERHRLLWLYLQRETDFRAGPRRFLHIAPEFCFLRILKNMPRLEYVSVDRSNNLADYRMDITDLHLESESFDCLLCVHVLEHVSDDLQALREMRRILKPGAWAIIGVPIDHSRRITLEDPLATSDADRLKLFGQADHVRVYGNDAAQRFEYAGFEVTEVDYFEQLSAVEQVKYGVIGGEEIFHCKRVQ